MSKTIMSSTPIFDTTNRIPGLGLLTDEYFPPKPVDPAIFGTFSFITGASTPVSGTTIPFPRFAPIPYPKRAKSDLDNPKFGTRRWPGSGCCDKCKRALGLDEHGKKVESVVAVQPKTIKQVAEESRDFLAELDASRFGPALRKSTVRPSTPEPVMESDTPETMSWADIARKPAVKQTWAEKWAEYAAAWQPEGIWW